MFGDIFEYVSCEIMGSVICYHQCKLLKEFPGYTRGSNVPRIYQRFKDGTIFIAESEDIDGILWKTSDNFSLTTVNV